MFTFLNPWREVIVSRSYPDRQCMQHAKMAGTLTYLCFVVNPMATFEKGSVDVYKTAEHTVHSRFLKKKPKTAQIFHTRVTLPYERKLK